MTTSKVLLYPVVLLISLLAQQQAFALKVADVELPEQVSLANQTSLVLNGAGIRTKFFMDIYVGALYLAAKNNDAAAIIAADKPARIAMHFLYKESGKERQVKAWEKGFKKNLREGELAVLADRLEESKKHFKTMRRGETMYLDYVPGEGTKLLLNNQVQATIKGHDFFQAAMRVWIGEYPAQKKLKNRMLGLD